MIDGFGLKRVAWFAAAGVLVSVLSGCSLIATQLATDFSLNVETEHLTLAPGESGDVSVRIGRTVPIDVVPVPIVVSLHDSPSDVSADDLEMPSGIDQDEMTIEIAADADPRGPMELTLRATNGIKTREATFQLTITNP